VAQSIQLDGKPLHYTVTVGTLPVYDKDGKKSGEVVFTAYTVEGDGPAGDLRAERRAGRGFRLSQSLAPSGRSTSSSATRETARPIRRL
jgi:hypothetical protein